MDGSNSVGIINEQIQGKDIADIGCGFLSRSYDKSLAKSFTGLDNSKKIIEYRKKLDPKDKFLVADCCDIPLDSNSYDVAIVTFLIHHLPKNMHFKALTEAKRLAKKIIILDHIRKENKFVSVLQSIYWSTVDGGSYYNTYKEWEHLFKEAKLKPVYTAGKVQFVTYILEHDQ